MSHAELAAVLGSELDLASNEAWAKVRRLLESDPVTARQIAELEAMAAEAGLEARGYELVLAQKAHDAFERLSRSGGWEHPGEVIGFHADPEDDLPLLETLVRVAERRLAAEPGSKALQQMHQKLTTALAASNVYAQAARLDAAVRWSLREDS